MANFSVRRNKKKLNKISTTLLAMWELHRNAKWTFKSISKALSIEKKVVKKALKKVEKKHEVELLSYTTNKNK